MASSDHRLRNKVHAELTALLNGGQLAVTPGPVQAFLDHRLIARVARQYRAQQADAPTQGRSALVAAGVPGAGKSTLIDALTSGYRRIDPDQIKDIVLAELDGAGLIDVRHDHALADGLPVSPGELAGWVHNASIEAANQVRLASLQLGENFVMEGTLSWRPLTDSHVDELAAAGFERLTIVDVEVPLPVAVEQSKQRWWLDRHAGRLTHGAALGGRFIAESVLSKHFLKRTNVSGCAINARKLYHNANDAGIESELIVVTRTAAGSQYAAQISPDGVQPWQDASLGAVCTRCGSILRERGAIMRGFGANHVRR
ncbi:MAG: zeta toxin family protein [Mycobacterium sp.]